MAIYTQHNPIDLVDTRDKGDRPALPSVILLPLSLKRDKTAFPMPLKVALQLPPQLRHQKVAIHLNPRLKLHRGPLLIDLVSPLHIHVDTYSQDHVADIRGITYQFQQNSSNFLLPYQNIVWPLQGQALNTRLAQGLHDRQTHNQA
ncbi:hypothetical protein SAMN03159342_05492 [Pseudomonas sp. NFPP04]|nr:hypothetical protein SAMN03159342_05492 [Pseudomonas sp. NFPP04]SFK06538.1 hypothetical protein SAMN03159344_05591 [Pseudomonas sp. NFPP11]